MITEPKVIASESGHWYTKSGEPFYEIENKSKPGAYRPVTLRDAKKLDLVPSVTSVLSILAKPSLSVWKENQILLSAATSPHSREKLDAVTWANKVLEDAQTQTREAADKGTAIHGAIEKYLNGEGLKYAEFTIPVCDKLSKYQGVAEHSFAHQLGFGGKVDFHTTDIVIDFKTKDFDDPKKKLWYDEHLYQLSAYRLGLNLPNAKCENWYISTSVPGLIIIKEWTPEELLKGEEVFKKVLELWKLIKL